MTNAEFVETTGKLERYFNKEYTDEQLKVMFETFKSWSAEKYEKRVKCCIINCKYLPKIAEISNEDEKSLYQFNQYEQREYKDSDFDKFYIN